MLRQHDRKFWRDAPATLRNNHPDGVQVMEASPAQRTSAGESCSAAWIITVSKNAVRAALAWSDSPGKNLSDIRHYGLFKITPQDAFPDKVGNRTGCSERWSPNNWESPQHTISLVACYLFFQLIGGSIPYDKW